MSDIFYSLPVLQRTVTRKIDPQILSKILMQLKDRDKCIVLLLYYTEFSINYILSINNEDIKEILKAKELKKYAEFFKKTLTVDGFETDSVYCIFWSVTRTPVVRSHLNQALRLACRKAKISQVTPAELKEWKEIWF